MFDAVVLQGNGIRETATRFARLKEPKRRDCRDCHRSVFFSISVTSCV